jgi:hypothetical protein
MDGWIHTNLQVHFSSTFGDSDPFHGSVQGKFHNRHVVCDVVAWDGHEARNAERCGDVPSARDLQSTVLERFRSTALCVHHGLCAGHHWGRGPTTQYGTLVTRSPSPSAEATFGLEQNRLNHGEVPGLQLGNFDAKCGRGGLEGDRDVRPVLFYPE